MIVNILDTKGDFKKFLVNDEHPTTVDELMESIGTIEHLVGKRIILILRGLRWSVIETCKYIPMGVLDNEVIGILAGGSLDIEVSDM